MPLLGEITSLVYIAGIAKLALLSGITYLLFPELAALALDVFIRPKGSWARAGFLLILTPLAASVIGILLERSLGYGLSSIVLCITLVLLIIKILDSPVAPAISAGLLPIVLEEGSLIYPLAIFLGISLLVTILFLYSRIFSRWIERLPMRPDEVDDMVEKVPRHYEWIPFFFFFLLGAFFLVKMTGLRFILFPPLVVIAYEMLAHSAVCPWASKPVLLTAGCMLTAFSGVLAVLFLGTGPLAAILSVTVAAGIIRVFKLHAPPMAAIGLLPFVIFHPDFSFPFAVGGGTLLLVVIFLLYRTFSLRRGASPSS